MNNKNKQMLLWFAKFAGLFIFAMLTIIVCAGVWGYNPEAFVKWCAGFLFLANGFIVYKVAKKFTKEYNEFLNSKGE